MLRRHLALLACCLIFVAQCKSRDFNAAGTERVPSGARAVKNLKKKFTWNAMAPLTIGNIEKPDAAESGEAWKNFEAQLSELKQMGIVAVSTDVWWGVVEKRDNHFEWGYYDKLAKAITTAGLRWVPILSFHQCGGNVGDECDIPIPKWLWKKYTRGQIKSADDLKYKSEQGNVSNEVVSAWATPMVLAEYTDFMKQFQRHFEVYATQIEEINISLGPAGELRYPSYNSHDKDAGYPTRGALQSYSRLAVESFQDFVSRKYKRSMKQVSEAWKLPVEKVEDIAPPKDPAGFFERKEHLARYGQDFFDWYSNSLQEHGRILLGEAREIFGSKRSAFYKIDIGAKVPGIHWRMGTDRLAELAAGLLTTSVTLDSAQTGHGYEPLVNFFAETNKKWRDAPRFILHFTCLEMGDGEGGESVASKAKSLVFWMGAEAAKQGVTIKGENALAGSLAGEYGWKNMRDAIELSAYEGLTILRMGDILQHKVARDSYSEMIKAFPAVVR